MSIPVLLHNDTPGQLIRYLSSAPEKLGDDCLLLVEHNGTKKQVEARLLQFRPFSTGRYSQLWFVENP
jgi:hypothetical protein